MPQLLALRAAPSTSQQRSGRSSIERISIWGPVSGGSSIFCGWLTSLPVACCRPVFDGEHTHPLALRVKAPMPLWNLLGLLPFAGRPHTAMTAPERHVAKPLTARIISVPAMLKHFTHVWLSDPG